MTSKENMDRAYETIVRVAAEMTTEESLRGLFHQVHENVPLPSGERLGEVVQLARSILFPGYFGQSRVAADTLCYHTGVAVERFYRLLREQVMAGLCFSMAEDAPCAVEELDERAAAVAEEMVARLPGLRRVLATDVEAAFNGDPAATSFGEVISCYPVIRTLTNHRLAHELHLLGVPLIPRMISELAHSETGIDIHPAAQIGHHFTIDHGTGVVVGATCIIGNNVKLYQGVTLGALSFPLDGDGNPIKGIPRHPIIGNDVVVYSNATILGRITVGDGCVIGANQWVTTDITPGTTVKGAK